MKCTQGSLQRATGQGPKHCQILRRLPGKNFAIEFAEKFDEFGWIFMILASHFQRSSSASSVWINEIQTFAYELETVNLQICVQVSTKPLSFGNLK